MSTTVQPVGRRERNKQAKFDRIVAAATELFAEHGVDEVTTQQIADAADIGTGTLFLYAKTKGELLLLVQNSLYRDALAQGRRESARVDGVLDAILAIVRPIVACNRKQLDNGRTYLREMLFGDATEPHHAEALAIVTQTEDAIALILQRDNRVPGDTAATIARVISAITFLGMAAAVDPGASVTHVVRGIGAQIAEIMPR